MHGYWKPFLQFPWNHAGPELASYWIQETGSCSHTIKPTCEQALDGALMAGDLAEFWKNYLATLSSSSELQQLHFRAGIFSNRLFYCDPAGCQQMAPLNKATRCPCRAKLFFLHCDPDTYALYICLKKQSCRDHQKSEKLSNCKNNNFSLSII